MKLYYMTGSCSLAAHICLTEANARFDIARLDRKNRTFNDGESLDQLNPKGYVPVLRLDGDHILTENVAVLLYIADQYPASQLAPAPAAGLERYRMIEWLAFINSEVHKAFSSLFHPGAGEELKRYGLGNLHKRVGWLDTQLASKRFIAADHFTVADAYLFTVLRWSSLVKFDLDPLANVQRYVKDIAVRPAVIAAMKAEGLVK